MKVLNGASSTRHGPSLRHEQCLHTPSLVSHKPVKAQRTPSAAAVAAAAAAAVAAVVVQSSVAVQPALSQQLCPSEPEVVLQLQRQQPAQQSQQKQQWHAASLPQPLAELAGFFDSDVSDPFTLYGTNFKKYEIEQMQGEKVVSRSRGFTIDTCVSGKTASEETPMFNGMSTGAKVEAGDDLLCKRATGSDLKVVCKQSCGSACEAALDAYEARLQAETGLSLGPKERQRVLKNCRHSCAYECTKSGKAHDFVVPSRR